MLNDCTTDISKLFRLWNQIEKRVFWIGGEINAMTCDRILNGSKNYSAFGGITSRNQTPSAWVQSWEIGIGISIDVLFCKFIWNWIVYRRVGNGSWRGYRNECPGSRSKAIVDIIATASNGMPFRLFRLCIYAPYRLRGFMPLLYTITTVDMYSPTTLSQVFRKRAYTYIVHSFISVPVTHADAIRLNKT